jgi:putative endopeptidase
MHRRILKPLVLAIGLGIAGIATASTDFDAGQVDHKYSPCQDFNNFVNAKWDAANPIPPDQTRWGSFNVHNEKSLNDQHALAEAAAKDAAHATPGSVEQKIGWLYASGMDEAAIDKAGFDPIKPELASIAALKTPKDIIAWLQQSFAKGDERVFRFGSGADYKNAKLQIANADQGGLSLPTTDYYTKPEHKEIRDAYVKHVAKLFELTGVPAADAAKKAANVLAFETRLAEHSIPRVEMRKPENQYHFVSVAEADKVTPHFEWNAFFKSQGVTVDKGFSLSQPKFFAEFDKMLTGVPVGQWRDYLSAHTIAGAAPFLSKPFQEESFAFNGKTLGGQPEEQVRWKRVLGAINRSMGQGLGQLYVAKYFPPEAKARAAELVDNVRNALKNRIEHLDWMSDATKAKAIAKWNTFLPKIGYPDTWRSWDGLTIKADDYFGNLQAARKFNYDYDIAKIGKPTDRMEWFMTPQTVNAYYNPTDNTINFPAAILQPPFFYADGDDAINYGGIGAVIGHEASHGFDDQGSQFDGDGNNANWWTKEDRAKFDERTQKLVDQFDAYAPIPSKPDKHVNGRLTLGENIGDLGGINAAYDALQMALAKNPKEAAEKIDGYTQDQRFFLNWARVWRGATREQRQLVLLNADPHSPAQFRAIGAPSNMPQFAQAFSCKAGDAMVRSGDKQVKIW